jgi:very-short-patch-repair endonuclease
MRANPTEAERRLWSLLRAKRFRGVKFKRQQVIELYIVDFVCFAHRVIVEADGSQHSDNKNDERRDSFLQSQGFRVLRFWNNDVLGDADSVLTALLDALTPSPSQACGLGPSLSRQGRGDFGATYG